METVCVRLKEDGSRCPAIMVQCRRCCKQAFYGHVYKRPLHCGGCRGPGETNVASPRCVSCQQRRTRYGYPARKATHCGACKTDAMVAVGKKCLVCNQKTPSFGFAPNKPTHCRACKTDGMADVANSKCQGCLEKVPSFGLQPGKPTHCASCKTPEMEDVKTVTAPCGSCGLQHRRDRLKDGLCSCCRQGLGRVEHRMRRELEKLSDAWIFDKPAPGVLACSDRRYRGDAWLGLAGHVVVVECDEDQHKHYDTTCELRRLAELWAACEGRPLVVVRWNPDGFRVARTPVEVSERVRLRALLEAVKAALATPPATPLSVRYLFYDEDREASLQASLKTQLAGYLEAGEALS